MSSNLYLPLTIPNKYDKKNITKNVILRLLVDDIGIRKLEFY